MNAEHNEKLKSGCRTKTACKGENKTASVKNILDGEWEVFVIKKDEVTGKLIAKVACCALAPV